MNALAPEYSSDCDSGWTLYLEQSFLSPNTTNAGTQFIEAKTGFCDHKGKNTMKENKEDDDDEGLSMVSDASSGPPLFNEDEGYLNYGNGYYYSALKDVALTHNGVKRQKKKEHRRGQDQELASFLDDTASSPAFNFSKNNFAHVNNPASMQGVLEYSQALSANHFQRRSAYQNHFGYTQTNVPGNQLQNNQWF